MGDRRGRWFNRQWMGSLLILLFSGLSHAGTHHYYYTDPQGTVLAKTDASGNIIATYDYAPYGTTVAGMSPAPDGPGYTGHVNDPDTGLVYMQARYYDSGTGRFLSLDPVPPSAGNAFNFSRYAYANNNPVVNIDPDGHEAGCVLQKSHCIGNNPSAKAAAKDVNEVSIGIGKAIANGLGDLRDSLVSSEGEPLAASNDQQAAGMMIGAVIVGAAKALATDDRSVVANPIPGTLARVVPAGLKTSTLGAPAAADVFVTNAAQIRGLSAQQISQKLTIPMSSTGYSVIEFPSSGLSGIASPVNRSNPGFVGKSRTLGGASEFVIPNGPVPSTAVTRTVQ